MAWLAAVGTVQLVPTVAQAAPTEDIVSYADDVLADNPQAYWSLDGMGPAVPDLSSNGHVASLGASAVAGGPSALAAPGGASVSAPSGQDVLVDSTNPVPSGASTVELWHRTTARPDPRPSSAWLARWGNRGLFVTEKGYLAYTDGVAVTAFMADPWPADARWHQYAISVDGSGAARLYIDGARVSDYPFGAGGSEVGPAVPASPAFALVGIGGAFDEVSVYPTTLTAARLRSHWKVAAGDACTPASGESDGFLADVLADEPVAAYDFEDQAGAPPGFEGPVDVTGNCRNASLVGATASVSGLSGAGQAAGFTDAPTDGPSPMLVLDRPGALPARRSMELWFRGTKVIAADGGSILYVNGFAAQLIGDSDSASRPFGDGLWHQLALVQDGTATSFFVDGRPARTAAPPSVWGASGSWITVGGPGAALDDVSLYDTALSAAQIADHFAAGVGAPPTCAEGAGDDAMYSQVIGADGPIAHLRLGDRTGSGGVPTFAADSSGHCAAARFGVGVVADGADAAVAEGDGSVAGVVGKPVVGVDAAERVRTADWWFRSSDASPGWLARWGYDGLWVDGADLSIRSDADAVGPAVALAGPIADGAWHHLAVTQAPGEGPKVFVDGQLVLDQSSLGDRGATSSLLLGGVPGTYDEVALYPSALSTARVLAHAQGARNFRTQTTLDVAPARLVAGESATLHASVSSAVAGVADPAGQVRFLDGSTVLHSSDLVEGDATWITPDVSVGRHRYEAVYVPVPGYAASASAVVNRVASVAGAVAITAELSTTEVGEEIELTASVGAAAGETAAATGQVTFLEGTTVLGRADLDGEAVATLRVTDLAAGTHDVRAEYAGDSSHPAGTSDSTALVVHHRTFELGDWTDGDRWAPVGGTTRFYGTLDGWTDRFLASDAAVASVREGEEVLASGGVDHWGNFQVEAPALAVGHHQLQVVVADVDGAYAPLVRPVSLDVLAPAVITVTGPPDGTTFTGPSNSISVHVVGPDGQPATGSAEAASAGASVGSGNVSNGDGAINLRFLRPGTHTLDLSFSASGGAGCINDPYRGTACGMAPGVLGAAITVTQPAAVATAVSLDQFSAGEEGTLLQAHVDPATGPGYVEAGLIEVFVDGASVGRGSGPEVRTEPIEPGVHDVEARYTGQGPWASSSVRETQYVVKELPSMAVAIDPASPVAGEDATIVLQLDTANPSVDFGGTAWVTAVNAAHDNEFVLDEPMAALAVSPNGRVEAHGRFLHAGTFTISAGTSGDAHHFQQQASETVTVTGTATETTLVLGSWRADRGAPVPFTVSVESADPAATQDPGGQIQVLDEEGNLLAAVASADKSDPDGTSQFSGALGTGTLGRGVHHVRARYVPSSGYLASTSADVAMLIDRVRTQASLLADPGPTVWADQELTLTGQAATSYDEPDLGGNEEATTISVDGTVVAAAAGATVEVTQGFAPGVHLVRVEYAGSTSWTSASFEQVINVVPRFDVDIEAPSTVGRGDPVEVGVDVDAHGLGPVGRAIVTISAGSRRVSQVIDAFPATVAFDDLPVGHHDLEATVCPYRPGQAGTGPASCEVTPVASSTVPLEVVKASSGVASWSGNPGPNTVRALEPFTLSATLGSSWSGSITGEVEWRIDGSVYATTPVASNRATLPHPGFAAGNHTITAAYGGDGDHVASTTDFEVLTRKVDVTLDAPASSASIVGQTLSLPVSSSVSPSDRAAAAGPLTVTETVGTTTTTVASGVLVQGGAVVDVEGLAVGTHHLQVVFAGDQRNGPAAKAVTVVVRKATTMTALTVDPAASEPGEPVVLRAAVTAEAASEAYPAGTVAFTDGGTSIGEIDLDADGVANLPIAHLAAGLHHFQATYAGSTSMESSSSPTLARSAVHASTVTATTGGASVSGEQVQVHVVVAGPGTTKPTGTVAVVVDGTVLVTGSLGTDAMADLPVSFDRVGDRAIEVRYLGDTRFAPGSGALTQRVAKAATKLTLTMPTSAARGDDVTIEVAASVVAPGSGTPQGSATVTIDGEAHLVNLDGSGRGSFVMAGVAEGRHGIAARYDGDRDRIGADASGGSVLVRPGTVTVLQVSLARATVGDHVTFTAKVRTQDDAAAATGQVVFLIDGAAEPAVALGADGIATFDAARLDAGHHVVTARFVGGDAFHGSEDQQPVDVARATPTVALAIAPSVLPLGGVSVLTATVVGAVPLRTPGGYVAFYDGSARLGSAAIGAGSKAALTARDLGLGGHPIEARYEGDPSFGEARSNAITVQVVNAATTVALSTVANPSVVGERVVVRASVTASPLAAGVVSGQVELRDGATVIGTASLTGGSVSFDLDGLDLGTHPLRARYLPTTGFDGSPWATLDQHVADPVSVTVVRAAGQSDPTYGDLTTFTVQVAPSAAGSPAATGTVELLTSAGALGAPVAIDGSGTATVQRRLPSAGDVTIWARYSGDERYGTVASADLDLAVTARATATTITLRATSGAGRQVPVDVTVSAGGLVGIAGAVEVLDDLDHVVGSGSVANGTGTVVVEGLARGAHALRAHFLGTTNLVASSSVAVPHAVGDALVSAFVPTGLARQPNGDHRVTMGADGGAVVDFDGRASTGPGTLYASWQFGDGGPGTGDQVQHRYTSPGIYRVALTVADSPDDPDQVDVSWIRLVVVPRDVAKAVAGDDRTVDEETAVWFDASASRPTVGADVRWSFPDGSFSDDARARHVFDTPGTYTVTLRVSANGTIDTDEVRVKVLQRRVDDGLTVTVRSGAGGQLIGGAEVVVASQASRFSGTTDGTGKARIRGLANGRYTVYAIAPGFQPAQAQALVEGSVGQVGVGVDPDTGVLYGVGGTELTMLPGGPQGGAEITAELVDRDQYGALGIDTSAPENSIVHRYEIRLDFASEGGSGGPGSPGGSGDELRMLYLNGAGDCVASCGAGWSSGGEDHLLVPSTTPGLFSVLTFPLEAKYLKQFFQVKLTVLNLAPGGFDFVDGAAQLRLPAGMSLAELGTEPQSLQVPVGTIAGGSSRTTSWIVRGDAAGDYDLSAQYAGVLDPFGTPVHLAVATANPVHVEDSGSLEMTAEVDARAHMDRKRHGNTIENPIAGQSDDALDEYRFSPYRIRSVTFHNPSSVPMYNVTVANVSAGEGFVMDPHAPLTQVIPEIPAGGSRSLGPFVMAPMVRPAENESQDWDVWADVGRDLVLDGSSLRVDGKAKQGGIIPRSNEARGADLTLHRGGNVGEWNLYWDDVAGAGDHYEVYQAPAPGAPFNTTPLLPAPGASHLTVAADGHRAGERGVFAVITVHRDGTREMLHKTLIGYSEVTSPTQITSAEYLCSPTLGSRLHIGWDPDSGDVVQVEVRHFDVDPDSPEGNEVVEALAKGIYAPTDPWLGQDVEIPNLPEGGNERFDVGDHGAGTFSLMADDIWPDDPPDRAVVSVRIGIPSHETDAQGHPVRAWSQPVVMGARNGGCHGGETYDVADSLGALCTTFTQGQGTTGEANPTSDCPADPVNQATGALVADEVDAVLPGPGEPFTFERTYNSTDAIVGAMGPGWAHRYEASIVPAGAGKVTFRGAAGTQVRFEDNGDGTYKALSPSDMTLVRQPADVLDPTGPAEWNAYTLGGTRWQFDALGRLRAVRDRNGYGQELTYTSGKLTTVSYNGWDTTLVYTGNLLTKVNLPNGRSITYQYTSGRLTRVTDPGGYNTYYAYDATGRLVRERNHLQQTQQETTYGANGRVATQLDAEGGLSTFGWTPGTGPGAGRATMTDPRGGVWTEDYVEGRLVLMKDPLDRTSRTQYDAKSRVAARIDGRGRTTRLSYDSKGRLVEQRSPVPGATSQTWTYNADNQVSTHRDTSGRLTSYAYDSQGRLTGTQGPGDQRSVTRFNSVGLPDWVCNGSGCKDDLSDVTGDRAFTYGYDPHWRPVTVTTPGGRATRIDYDDVANVVDVYDPGAGGVADAAYRTRTTYDGLGRPKRVDEPSGLWMATTYDQRGHVTLRTDALGQRVENTYFLTGELKNTIENSRTPGRTYERDANGNVTAEVSATGRRTTYGYDAANQRTSMVEPLGNVAGASAAAFTWTYQYDGAGNQTVVVRPGGYRTTTTYDAGNRPTSTADSLGRTTSATWTADGAPKTATNADKRSASWTYDDAGREVGATDVLGNTTATSYDGAGNPVTKTTVDGTTRFGYDADGLMTSITDPRGVGTPDPDDYRTVMGRDGSGNITFVDDAKGGRTTYGYDAAGRQTSMTDQLGKVTTTAYDKLGRTTQVTLPRASASESAAIVFYTYSDGGATTKVSRSAGDWQIQRLDYDGMVKELETSYGVTRIERDANGRPTKVTAPGASTPSVSTVAYQRTGTGASYREVTVATDPAGRETRTATDALGQVRSERNPAGGLVEYGYTAGGRISSVRGAEQAAPVTGPIGVPGSRPYTTFTYSTASTSRGTGEKVTRTDPLGNDWTTMSDGAGRPVSQRSPEGRTSSWTYDRVGNLLTQTAPGGLTTANTWSPADELLQTRLPGQDPVTFGYDAVGNATSVVAATGATTTMAYDARHNLTSRTGPDATSELLEYDGADRPTKYTDQLGNRTFYSYDAKGNLSGVSDAVSVEAMTYDAVGHLTSRSGTGPNLAAATESFTYDPTGILTSSTGGGGTTTYALDAAGRPTTVTSPAGQQTGYGWAPDGSLESMTYPSGLVARSDYQADGALRAVRFQIPGQATPSTHSRRYDRDGLLVAEQVDGDNTLRSYQRDPSSGLPTRYVDNTGPNGTWTEDLSWQDGRLSNRAVHDGDGANRSIAYEYDDAGQLTGETTTGAGAGTRTYGYTTFGALDWSRTNGQLTDLSYDAAHQVTSVSGPAGNRVLTYDRAGRRLTDKVSGGRQVTTTYDALGREAGASVAVPSTPTVTQSLAYDGEGHLTKVTTGTGSNPQVVTDLTWDTLAPVPRLISSTVGSSQRSMGYVGDRRVGVVASQAGDPSASSSVGFSYDALGNPTGSVGPTGAQDPIGGLTATAFGPFGEAGASNGMGIGFQGELVLPDGLVHLRARNYDASTASFTTRDPLPGVVGSSTLTNPYAYANNDPIGQSDPLGLRGQCKGQWWEVFACDGLHLLESLPGVGAFVGVFDKNYRENLADKGIFGGFTQSILGGFDDMIRNPTKIIPNMINGLKGMGAAIGDCIMTGAGEACGHALFAVVMLVVAKVGIPKIGLGGDSAVVAETGSGLAEVEGLGGLEAVAAGLSEEAGGVAITAAVEEASSIESLAALTEDLGSAEALGGASTTVGESGIGGSCLHSFDPATEVLMADGSVKAIKDVRVGDRVRATDPVTGRTSVRRVTAVHVNRDTDLADVAVRSEDGRTGTIHTTQHHRIWDETEGGWVDAGDLVAGHRLESEDGDRVVVTNVQSHVGDRQMRDLTVEDVHTFYVIAGTEAVLVHNCTLPRSSRIENVDGSYDLTLGYKDEWNAAQRAAADEKVAALNRAEELRVTEVSRNAAVVKKFRAGERIPTGADVDHTIDLQLGGADDFANLSPLDQSVNRSLGSQIGAQLRSLSTGTRIARISIL